MLQFGDSWSLILQPSRLRKKKDEGKECYSKEIQIVLVFRKSSGGTREVEQDRAASIFYRAFKCILLVVNNESCIINDKEEVETPHVANVSHKKRKINKSIEPVDVVVEKVLSQFCSHDAPGQAELVSVWGVGTGKWGIGGDGGVLPETRKWAGWLVVWRVQLGVPNAPVRHLKGL